MRYPNGKNIFHLFTRYRHTFNIFLFIILNIFIYLFIVKIPFGKRNDNIGFQINDFTYIIVLIQSFWSNEIQTIYDFDSQIKAIWNATGVKVTSSMVMGHTPTALFLLLPFSTIANFNIDVSNALWISCSLIIFFFSLEKTSEHFENRRMNIQFVFFLLVCMFTFSFSMVHAISVGQLSILICGILILLILEIKKAKQHNRPPNKLLTYTTILILSIKLHYIFIGISTLFIFGYICESIISLVITLAILTLIGIWKGQGFLMDWVEQLRLFSTSSVPATYYTHYHTYKTFITFRSAFSQYIGGSQSILISYIISGISFLLICLMTIYKNVNSSFSNKIIEKATPYRLFISMMGTILLFMPYLGGYDDILLLLCFITMLLEHDYNKLNKIFLSSLFILSCLILNFNLFPISRPIPPFWLMKFFVLFLLLIIPKEKMKFELSPRRFPL